MSFTRNRKAKRFYRKHRKGITRLGVIAICSYVLFIAYLASLNMISVGMNSDKLEGLHYEQAGGILLEAGFTDIEYEAIEDLTIAEVEQEYMVSSVSINGDILFEDDSKYFYDADIIISYHTVKNIEMSFSYKDIKGDNYKDVISKLENEGFVNIRAEVLYDVVTGWVTDDGEVEYVSIDGDKKFKIGEEFRPDVEVVVAFHTYKKNAK